MIFTRKKNKGECNVHLCGDQVHIGKSFKFLGVLFDNKLIWIGQITSITNKCKGRFNVFKSIVGIN